MFGGYGIYFDGVMFALVADDVLYLKTDETTADEFKARGLQQFEYKKNSKLIKMSYYLAPEEIYDDSGEAATWADKAFSVALKSKKTKK